MNTNVKRLRRAARYLPLVALLGGCSLTTTPDWDRTFGQSAERLLALQTLNPDAGQNPDAVTGIDGRAGVSGQNAYIKSFTVQRNSNVALTGSTGAP
jgi:hypothetical protein